MKMTTTKVTPLTLKMARAIAAARGVKLYAVFEHALAAAYGASSAHVKSSSRRRQLEA